MRVLDPFYRGTDLQSVGQAVTLESQSRFILGTRVDATNYRDAAGKVTHWALQGGTKRVCVANVHTIMESFDSFEYRNWINTSDLVTPDGMPLVWALRIFGIPDATRVYGPDLVPEILCSAAKRALRVGLLGGSPDTLARFRNYIAARYPDTNIVYAFSPPYRPLTPEEDAAIVSAISESGVQILLIGLGNPKQEKWMYDHQHSVRAVMLGVGAAFDFLSGAKSQSPRWMMRLGLEWMYRLCTEPRRLWKRYLKHNPRFIFFFLKQYIRQS